ncbi:hypothetical protein [Microlunatus sp. GCM10028923]|uniref:hypothetical protein n=1 Tax=Microlunatus sp. GCM10028923 TaxID=3273400 RepID=UPI00360ED457
MRTVSLITAAVVMMIFATVGCESGTNPPPGDLRERLARALDPVDAERATLVRDEQRTSLTELPTAWLRGWLMIDVLHRGAQHPLRFNVALSDEDRAVVLNRNPEGFNEVVRDSAQPDAGRAADVARTFLDTTRDFRKWAYRVESTGDITWLPKPDARQAAARDELIKRFADQIQPPEPRPVDAGWAMVLWVVDGTELARHEVTVAEDGTVTSIAAVVASALPVPDSI